MQNTIMSRSYRQCQNTKEKIPAPRIRHIRNRVGWLMGFEPTTTGITIQDSTAELQPPLKEPQIIAKLALLGELFYAIHYTFIAALWATAIDKRFSDD
jgi:hypothetical protein